MTHVCVSGGRKGEVEEEEGVGKKNGEWKIKRTSPKPKKKGSEPSTKKRGIKETISFLFF